MMSEIDSDNQDVSTFSENSPAVQQSDNATAMLQNDQSISNASQYVYRSPVVAVLNDHEFELIEPFLYCWQDAASGVLYKMTVPAHYPFDGASVPRICWTLTGLLPTGVHLGAAAVHDYLYQRRGQIRDGEAQHFVSGQWQPFNANWTRKQCDQLFLDIMLLAGETRWKAWSMWQAVRLFGGFAWSR
jgi:hypothetical protein